jgi:TP901 family phage tail tape measure protein
MANVGEVSFLMTANLAGLTNALRRAGSTVEAAAAKMNISLGTVSKALIGVSAAATVAFGAITVKSVKTAADFEQSMANVAAISRATGDELKRLEETALQLGRTTIFTASQVAELETEFAKLGFTTDEIINAADATLQLATATGEDLASAAMVAGATLRGFGLDAKETGRVTNVMAESFASSGLDMEKFRESMKLVAPIARAAGFSIEDTTALLSKLADAGISGSLAGTALRQILSRLSDESSDLNKAFSREINTFDDLAAGLQELKAANFDLADAAKFVDVRSRSAFLTLVEGADDLASLQDNFEDATGAAKEMATVMQDTLKGALKETTSALEGFFIELDKNLGTSTFLQKFFGSSAEFVNSLTDELKRNREALERTREAEKSLGITYETTQEQLNNLQDALLAYTKGADFVIEANEEAGESTDNTADAVGRLSVALRALQDDMVAAVSVIPRDVVPAFESLKDAFPSADIMAQAEAIRQLLSSIGPVQLQAEGGALPEFDFEGFNLLNEATTTALQKNAEIYSEWANVVSGIFTSLYDRRIDEIRSREQEALDIVSRNAGARVTEIEKQLRRGVISEQQAADRIAIIESNKQKELEKIRRKADADERKAAQLRKISMISQATANIALGVSRALSQARPALAVAIGALGAVQIGTIAAQEFFHGGIVQGPMGRDNVPIRATAGEAVVAGDVVDQHGEAAVERFATTGDTSGLQGGGRNVFVTIYAMDSESIERTLTGPGREGFTNALADVAERGA